MNPIVYTTPLIAVTCVIAAMMFIILKFDQLRGTTLKDWMAGFWPSDRQGVLHLTKQNGVYFFVDRLIGWSEVIVRFSWVTALPAFTGGPRSVLHAAFLISLCFLIRLGSLTCLAAKKVKRFTIQLDYDGGGVTARTADEWRQFEGEMRSPLIFSIVASCGFLFGAVSL